MLKQVIGALAIIAGVGLLFNSCEDDKPTFQDPCPRDTCDPYGGIDKPQQDSTGGGSDSSDGGPDSSGNCQNPDTLGLALTLNAKTSGDQDAPVRGDGVNVKIYNFDGSELLTQGNPEKASNNNCDDGDNKAYFDPKPCEYFEPSTQYRVTVDTFAVVLNQSSNNDTTEWYLNKKKFNVTASSCDGWDFATQSVDLKKVN